MTATGTRAAAVPHLLQEWNTHRGVLEASDPAWLAALRRTGGERFAAVGFPGPREEAWRFTRLRAVERGAFRYRPAPAETVTPAEVARLSLGAAQVPRVALVDGVFSPALSALDALPQGISLGSLAATLRSDPGYLEPRLGRIADAERHRFVALSNAFLRDGLVVRASRNVQAPQPIHLLIINTGNGEPTVSFPRILIDAEAGSGITVLEEYVGAQDAPNLVQAVTEVLVGENASVRQIRLQREQTSTFHFGVVASRQAADSVFRTHSLSLGARLARVDVDVLLGSPGAECHLNGLYVTGGKQHVDHHTFVDHAAPHTTSRELYKGVLDGSSRAVFNGRVRVREGAQKIDAEQHNHNLLLSDQALVNTNPELEIFADDVKAAHGATIGQLDPDHFFYLRSRGIPRDAARRILIRGFAGQMLERIRIESVRDRLVDALDHRF